MRIVDRDGRSDDLRISAMPIPTGECLRNFEHLSVEMPPIADGLRVVEHGEGVRRKELGVRRQELGVYFKLGIVSVIPAQAGNQSRGCSSGFRLSPE